MTGHSTLTNYLRESLSEKVAFKLKVKISRGKKAFVVEGTAVQRPRDSSELNVVLEMEESQCGWNGERLDLRHQIMWTGLVWLCVLTQISCGIVIPNMSGEGPGGR